MAVRLFKKSERQKPVSNERDKRLDAIFAHLRRLDEQMRTLDEITSVLKRDVSRIDRMNYRTATKKPRSNGDREYSIGEVIDGI